MGNKKAIFAVTTTGLAAVATFVACGSDHAAMPDAPVVIHDSPVDTAPPIDASPDAPSFDLSCVGNSAPTPNANVTIAGTANVVGFNGNITFGALGSAAVELCTGDCTGSAGLGSAVTDGSGDFSFGPLATNGSALDDYVRVSHTSDRTVLGFPASPIATDVQQPIITFSNTLIAGLSMFGCAQNDATNGMIGVLVTDCANKPITDPSVTIAIKQAGSDVGDPPLNAGQLNSMAAGFYLICNVPAGSAGQMTQVTATYGTTDLRAHVVQVTAGTTTETIIRPGF